MTEFGRRKDGRVYPTKQSAGYRGITKQLTAKDLKHIHIHGLSLAGYAVDLADGMRKKALNRAVGKYGKADTMAELSLLRTKYEGNARMERVVDSDIAYIAKGKFEED